MEIILNPDSQSLATISTTALRDELARGLTLQAAVLTRLGQIWAELERRGDDLSTLKSGLKRTLPLIASGRLAAESVVEFASRPKVLQYLEGMPLDKQREYAAGKPLSVVIGDSVEEVPLAALPVALLPVVFGDGVERTPKQQRIAMAGKVSRKRGEAVSERTWKLRPDAEAGVIRIGHHAYTPAELTAALATLASPEMFPRDLPIDPINEESASVRLWPAEKKKLKDAANKLRVAEWVIIRMALRSAGLI